MRRVTKYTNAHMMDLNHAVRILQAAFDALPSPALMQGLIDDSYAAQERGYYTPQEDERLRDSFANYLAVRSSIWEMIQALRPHFKVAVSKRKAYGLNAIQSQAFATAFCGAEIIVRTGEYLIRLANKRDIVWQKLDEAEVRYGLKRKSFTRLYRQLTSALYMRGYYQALDYYASHKDNLHAHLNTDKLAPIIDMLETLELPSVMREQHLRRYRRFVNFSLRRRGLSTGRKTMFALFEATGSDIAELKIPLVKNIGAAKRVTPEIIQSLKSQLRPGDVIITRHDDAMSNVFLPGFWPHGALYIGPAKDRTAFKLDTVNDGFSNSDMDEINILEAKKDGVLLRTIEETLQVDAFTVLRPNLTQAQIGQALARGLSHAGKLYDFVFDFATSERLVCTEVIYRAYHGVGEIDFSLSTKAGRKCLSAEDFLNQALLNDWFEPVQIYGVSGHSLEGGGPVRDVLAASFEASFKVS